MSMHEHVNEAIEHLQKALDVMEAYGINIDEHKKARGILAAIATLEDRVIGDYE